MSTPPPNRAEAAFNSALALPPAERAAYVDAACAGEEELAREVRALLAAHEAAGDFLRTPAPDSPEIEAEPACAQPEEGGERIGRYKLLQEIGEGGFGTVWMAEQMEPVSRRVALKIIKLGMDTREVIARFEAERQALAMMDHPNIAKVLDAGATDQGRPFFVMELVKGIPITRFCDERQLGTRERLALFGDVCAAINHAHQKGVIHRDIKPSNVMVTLHGDKAVVKVIDFGIAKATQGKLTDKTLFTRFEQFIGTPVYMSPEQAALSGLDIDTRSDIYALGILLYELLTGKPPFDAKSLASAGYEEMRRIIREVEPPKPSSRLSTAVGDERTMLARARHIEPAKLNHIVEPDLDWIVMKAIEKDRARRYETANGLAQDIQRFLADEPVSATPPSTGYKFRKFARRNKTALRVAAGIAAVLIAATVVSVWQALRATHAEELARQRVVEVAAERDAKDKARLEAEAVVTIFRRLFRFSDEFGEGETEEHFTNSLKKLDSDLANQPERRVKVQEILSVIYSRFGRPAEAITLQENVRNYYLATLGPEHQETLDAMSNLALLYTQDGRRDDALKLRETVIEVRKKMLALSSKINGLEHSQTLRAMQDLAEAYARANRPGEALKLLEETVALYRKVSDPQNPATLEAIENLAYYEDIAGAAEESIKLREELLTLRRKVNGSEHSDTLLAMERLADGYGFAGRGDDALKLREEALVLYRKMYGSENANTGKAIESVADSYDVAGRSAEAIKLREEALALHQKLTGSEHPKTIKAMESMMASYEKAGRSDDALRLREKILTLQRKTLGMEDPDTLKSITALAGYYSDAGRWDEALPLLAESSAHQPNNTLLTELVSSLQAWFGKDADHAATCRRMLDLATATDDDTTAERAAKAYCFRPSSDPQLLEAAFALARRAVERGQSHKYFAWFQMALGMAEYRRGNYAEADKALSAALQFDTKHYSLKGLAQFYQVMSLFRQGRDAEARKLFTETSAQMKPLPADERQPLPQGAAYQDDLILWLAFKEAKALLEANATTVPAKRGRK